MALLRREEQGRKKSKSCSLEAIKTDQSAPRNVFFFFHSPDFEFAGRQRPRSRSFGVKSSESCLAMPELSCLPIPTLSLSVHGRFDKKKRKEMRRATTQQQHKPLISPVPFLLPGLPMDEGDLATRRVALPRPVRPASVVRRRRPWIIATAAAEAATRQEAPPPSATLGTEASTRGMKSQRPLSRMRQVSQRLWRLCGWCLHRLRHQRCNMAPISKQGRSVNRGAHRHFCEPLPACLHPDAGPGGQAAGQLMAGRSSGTGAPKGKR